MGVKGEAYPDDSAVRAAWLSFVGGYTQGEIAVRLGISQAKVHRLIAEAQRAGLIRFEIDGRPQSCLEYEEALVGQFGLRHCIVAPDTGGKAPPHGDALSLIAGRTLHNFLLSTDTRQVGIGKGRTLKSAISAMPRLSRPDLSVVSVSGSLTPKLSANPYDVVHMAIERTGGEGYFLPVPYIAADAAERDAFLKQQSVRDLLNKARRSDLFVIGIGSLDDRGHVLETGMISETERRRLVAAGAVGDMMGRFLDRDGRQLETEFNQRAVGLQIEDIRGARVLALAGSAAKSAAVLAGLRTGVITDLVVDEALAYQLAGARRALNEESAVGAQKEKIG